MRRTALPLLSLGVLFLLGCAPVAAADSTAQQRTAPTGSAPEPLLQEAPQTATGEFVSLDGLTSGKIEVTLEPFTEPDGSQTKVATVRFTELDTPYSRLGVGGSTSPRGDDRCFDEGLRSGGGDIHPKEGLEALTSTMPAETMGHFLYEVVLLVNAENAASGWSECMNSIVARAPLAWSG